MDEIKKLQQRILERVGEEGLENTPIPDFVVSNLNQKLQIRSYQKIAFQYFINYWSKTFTGKPEKNQLLFHMATGSGKTLMMAGLILYLYEQGYRNFLFFVNSTNIIDKTRDNFFNDSSIKYLFNTSITQGEKKVFLKEVDNFQSTDDKSINIAFSTIQGLHLKLNNPQENTLTFDDFQDKKIVLISDEAHHINVETKAGLKTNVFGDVTIQGSVSKEEAEEIISWESTVNRIFNANPENVLLEFTATVDFNNPNIAKKYAERLIFDYQLKQFRIDGYSKDVQVLQADSALIDRALQAILLSQYRRKIFEKNKLIIKPVILFKSKTIAESKDFQEVFVKAVETLTVKKLADIKINAKDEVLVRMFKYFDNNKISLENLVSELKEDFSAEKTISVNSKEESDEKQLAINTLEAPDNEYRAVFAVDKLNEGWDVLNLFDIVRLDDKKMRDSRNNIPGKETIAQAQLIGRGARYCPFRFNDSDDPSKRKFDDDVENEMRICEELYYHSSYNPKYIQELNSALIKTGIVADRTIKRSLTIKDDFKDTKFFKSGMLFLNEQQKYTREDVFGLPSSVRDTHYSVSLRTGFNLSSGLFDEQSKKGIERKEKDFSFKEINRTIVKKAIYKLEFYSFSNLKAFFPNLESLDDFIENKNYLGNLKMTISGTASQINTLTADDALDAVLQVLEKISKAISGEKLEYKGSKEFKPYMVKDKLSDKTLNFAENESDDKEFGKSMSIAQETNIYLDLSNKSWYVFNDSFGTSEEKHFVKYIDKMYHQLKDKYDEVYLVRNERFFKLYNFDDGRPLEPDYVLFLYQKAKPKNMYYQVFIEPKGNHLKEADAWKQNFLVSLKKEHKVEQLWEDRKYLIWGMPFYNNNEETKFDEEFSKEII
jgi:type III restriction enzyme